MRGFSKVVCRAKVVISGMDVKDITEIDPVATVTIDAPGDGRQLARFAGMCVVAMLRATRKTPEMTEPFAKQGWIVCAELAEPSTEADLTDFSIAAGVRPEDVAEVVESEMLMADAMGRKLSMETMLTIAFPRVGADEQRKGKKVRFRAELHEARKGAWVRLRSRNAMNSAEGILCMLEQIAHEQPREVAERVAKVCQRVFEIHAEGVGKATPLSFKQATAMYRLVSELSQAGDPLTAPGDTQPSTAPLPTPPTSDASAGATKTSPPSTSH